MKFLLLLICSLTCLVGCHPSPSVQDSAGRRIELSDLHGKWLIVNYWADWCHPCLTELPELNRLQNHHKAELQVIGVNFDHLPAADLQAFAQKLGVQFSLVSEFPSEAYHLPAVSSLPVTFVINPQGKLVETLYGPQTEESISGLAARAPKS
ncbi:MAG: TlpA disulfide reductase family protein [Gammaproteobacteria bacterium]